MKEILVVLALLFSTGCYAQTSLVLSKDLQLTLQQPSQISHVDNLLILKYADWYFSEERLDPTSIYPSVDLTGLEREYFEAVFNPDKRGALPGWLASLAVEQADSLGLNKSNVYRRMLSGYSLLSVFNKNQNTANLFIVNDQAVIHLQCYGSRDRCERLFNAVSER